MSSFICSGFFILVFQREPSALLNNTADSYGYGAVLLDKKDQDITDKKECSLKYQVIKPEGLDRLSMPVLGAKKFTIDCEDVCSSMCPRDWSTELKYHKVSRMSTSCHILTVT